MQFDLIRTRTSKTGCYGTILCLPFLLAACGGAGSEASKPDAAGISGGTGGRTVGSGDATGGSSLSTGGSSTGGQITSSGGSPAIDGSGGDTASGGSNAGTGGSATATGGNSTASGGSGTGGRGAGGSGTGGQAPPDGTDGWGGLKNPPVKSAGCGKPAGFTSGTKTSMGKTYAIDLPVNYDPDKPNVVVFGYHYSGGSASIIKGSKYYHVQELATADNIPTIFIAPNHSASQADHAVFLDILAYVEANACVDTTRVFSMGYSLGAMMSYSLSTNHQDKLRAVATIEAANFNVWLPNPKVKAPIAYMGITGMADTLCMWDGGPGKGAKAIALEKAADNGCTVPAGDNIPTWKSGNHTTYEFPGCKTDYPLVVPTFGGPHGGAEVAKDPGSSSTWVPKEIWEFFKRF